MLWEPGPPFLHPAVAQGMVSGTACRNAQSSAGVHRGEGRVPNAAREQAQPVVEGTPAVRYGASEALQKIRL